MINVLRRFSQPLMVLITVVVIITFAWWGPSLGDVGRSRDAVMTAFGKAYNLEDVQRIQGRLLVHMRLQGAYINIVEPGWFRSGSVTDSGVRNAIVLDHEAEALGLSATEEEAATMMKTMPAFMDREGGFDPAKVDAFIKTAMGPQGYTASQLFEFMEREVRVKKMQALIGATVAVTPDEVRDLFFSSRLKTEASYVAFSALEFVKDVKVTEEETKKRYEDQKDVFFKTDETRTVRFASFMLPSPADGKPLETEKRTELLQALVQKAYDLAGKLAAPGENFDELAKAAGATLGETKEHFEISDEPEELEGSPDAVNIAFQLTKEKPFSKHVILQKGAYVMMLKEIKAPVTKPFESVKPEIEATLKMEKAAELARAKAAEMLPKIAEGKKAGKGFHETAESLKLKPVAFPAFTRPQALSPRPPFANEVTEATRKLAPGDLSEVIRTEKGGIIVHLDQRPAVDEKGIADAKASATEEIRRKREYFLFNGWLTERRAAAGLAPVMSEG